MRREQTDSIPTPLYFECHVTTDPLVGDKLEEFKTLCKIRGFRVAKLLMKKKDGSPGKPSAIDSFCTGRDASFSKLNSRMFGLLCDLHFANIPVRRHKIEAALIDVRAKPKEQVA